MSFRRPLTRVLAVVAVASVFAVLTPSAALAAPHDLDQDGIRYEPYTWNFSSAPFGVVSASYSASGTTYTDAFDSSAFSVWSENELGESTDVPTAASCTNAQLTEADAGDLLVSCDSVMSTIGLTLQGEARIYAPGDMVRTLVMVSNPTTSPIGFSWSFDVDFYGGPAQRATSTTPQLGEVEATATDTWVYNAEDVSLNSTLAWGMTDAGLPVERVREFDSNQVVVVSDTDVDGTQNTLEPGESLAFAFFQKLDPAGTAASRSELEPNSDGLFLGADENLTPTDDLGATGVSSTEAIQAATAEFAEFSERLSRGIPEGVTVANWQPLPEAAEDPELAVTGTNNAVVITASILAAVLLLGGVVLLVLRRRSRAREPQ